MGDILTFTLHYDGAFNKNSLGAVAEAARLAGLLGGEAHAVVLGDASSELCATLGRLRRGEGLPRRGARRARATGRRRDGGSWSASTATPTRCSAAGCWGSRSARAWRPGWAAGSRWRSRRSSVRDGKLVAQRPILGDSAISEIEFAGEIGIVIGRLNAFDVPEPTGALATVEDVTVAFNDFSTRARMVTRGEQRGENVDIEGAEILVAGGRGLGRAEGFELCEELAKALGPSSAVAATRAVVDAGWYPYAGQIGQTGKTVAPKLYFAAGISGAIQHKVGMASSENIVAVNKDANAPIFEFADLGIVGDLNRILPKLTAALNARSSG